jgi:hypothetical protein
MKAIGVALACGLLPVSVGSSAQDTTSSGKSKSADRTVTGCLAKGMPGTLIGIVRNVERHNA